MGKKVISETPTIVNAKEQVSTRFQSAAQECGICYSTIEEQGKLDSCGHDFCFSCITKWSKNENTCPVCKRRFSNIQRVWKRATYCEKEKKIKKQKNNVVKVSHKNQSSRNAHSQGIHLTNLIRVIQSYFVRGRNNVTFEMRNVDLDLQINTGSRTSYIPLQIRRSAQNNNNNNNDNNMTPSTMQNQSNHMY